MNGVVHAAGVDYDERTKRWLLAELEHRLAASANIKELGEYVDQERGIAPRDIVQE